MRTPIRIRMTPPALSGEETDLQKGEGDPHGERVDAGGHCQKKHSLYVQGIVGFLLLGGERFADHVETDQAQEEKGDPVVYGSDVLLKLAAEQIADRGHQRLETAKPQPHGGSPCQIRNRLNRFIALRFPFIW